MSRDTETEQTPRSNPNTQPGCSWAARSVQTCKVDICPLTASRVISSFQPRSPLSVHSWQRGFQLVIPIRSHAHLSPSSYTGGAPTKISKTLALSSPMCLLTRDASKTHGQRLARMVLGWLVFMPPTIALVPPHTCTWCSLSFYTGSGSTGGRTAGRDCRKSQLVRESFLFWACRDTSLVKGR